MIFAVALGRRGADSFRRLDKATGNKFVGVPLHETPGPGRGGLQVKLQPKAVSENETLDVVGFAAGNRLGDAGGEQ